MEVPQHPPFLQLPTKYFSSLRKYSEHCSPSLHIIVPFFISLLIPLHPSSNTILVIRSVPFQIDFTTSVECHIDDGSEARCESYKTSGTDNKQQCEFDVKFLFKLTNVGLSCQDIMAIRVDIGPLGREMIAINDVYNYTSRHLCVNETWLVPDRRSTVDLCNIEGKSWPIYIEIDEYFGKRANSTFNYKWKELGDQPTTSPTQYACQDCTLTGVISAGKFSNDALQTTTHTIINYYVSHFKHYYGHQPLVSNSGVMASSSSHSREFAILLPLITHTCKSR